MRKKRKRRKNNMDIKDYKLMCLGSPIDERDVKYSDIACAGTTEVVIPKSFHLGYQFKPKNQGQKSTCFLHATSECEEITYSSSEQYSVGFLNADRSESDFQGLGTIPRQVLKHLVDEGNVLNKDFPINEDYPLIKDFVDKYGKEQLFAKALEHRAKGYVSLDIEDIKRYLVVEKKPILISVKVYKNFYELQSNGGHIPAVPSGDYLGGHGMLIEGYDEDDLCILNSWGDLGDKGFVHLNINSSIIRELWGLTDVRVVPPKPTPTPTPVTPTVETLYRVQLEADTIRAYADELANKLRAKGIDCCIKIYPTPKGTLYKVQVGAFKIYKNAVDKKQEMINLGYKDAFITDK